MTTTLVTSYSGNQLGGYIYAPTQAHAAVIRDGVLKSAGTYTTAWIGDVLTRDRFTLNLGLRWDLQKARNLPSEVSANVSFPDLLPGISYTGSETLIDWSTWSPRVGTSWAVDATRKTVLRASYASYAAQLAPPRISGTSWSPAVSILNSVLVTGVLPPLDPHRSETRGRPAPGPGRCDARDRSRPVRASTRWPRTGWSDPETPARARPGRPRRAGSSCSPEA